MTTVICPINKLTFKISEVIAPLPSAKDRAAEGRGSSRPRR